MTETRKKTRRKATKTNAAGRRLLQSVKEMHHAVMTGDLSGCIVREVNVPEPREWDSKHIRALRNRVGITQKLFARLVGVSPELVEHWEQGVRDPSFLARRLLDQINADPRAFWESLVERRTVA